jgi:hypothetical protein
MSMFDLLLTCAIGVTTFAVCLESIATVDVRSSLAKHETDLLFPAACRERQQPSNYPWAKLIQRPESRVTYSPRLSAQ